MGTRSGRTASNPGNRPDTARDGRAAPNPEVSVVIPTYNEAGNILAMLDRVGAALAECAYEIVVVDDDSRDLTWRLVELRGRSDDHIRVIRRIGERGLSSAVMAGMSEARGRVLVVMDADLQHDETKIVELVSAITDRGVDLCVGSRHVAGGGFGQFGRRRRLASWTGATLARRLVGVSVTDPMSGFFAVSRNRFDQVAPEVNPRGFKILLEFLARGPEPAVSEVGYHFGARLNGTTKLNGTVVLDFLRAIAALTFARPGRSATGGRPINEGDR